MAPKTKQKTEFGDFQTPLALANNCCDWIACRLKDLTDQAMHPQTILEPTCGVGNFLVAASSHFKDASLHGVEINPDYVKQARENLAECEQFVQVRCEDQFQFDTTNFIDESAKPILVLGNPPWVTNSELGLIESRNLPKKSNSRNGNASGIDAITGSSNFDISEWIITRFLNELPDRSAVAFLCKTTVVRKCLSQMWQQTTGLTEATMILIDSKKHFDASVDACLFFAILDSEATEKSCTVYNSLDDKDASHRIGWVEGRLVSNLQKFDFAKSLRRSSDVMKGQGASGESTVQWRSGIKHDASSVMTFRQNKGQLLNGLGEACELEDDLIFPLLKSSDVAKGNVNQTDRRVLVTQKNVGDETTQIATQQPMTWNYLERHRKILTARKSRIYDGRPEFSIFGVGEYSFKPWKVAISGFYRSLEFRLVGPIDSKPVIFDDTVYFLAFDSKPAAEKALSFLNSQEVRDFFDSMIFWDAKRPITGKILRSLSLDL